MVYKYVNGSLMNMLCKHVQTADMLYSADFDLLKSAGFDTNRYCNLSVSSIPSFKKACHPNHGYNFSSS